jgi:trehalose 6-phosphate synthase/phosphatase
MESCTSTKNNIFIVVKKLPLHIKPSGNDDYHIRVNKLSSIECVLAALKQRTQHHNRFVWIGGPKLTGIDAEDEQLQAKLTSCISNFDSRCKERGRRRPTMRSYPDEEASEIHHPQRNLSPTARKMGKEPVRALPDEEQEGKGADTHLPLKAEAEHSDGEAGEDNITDAEAISGDEAEMECSAESDVEYDEAKQDEKDCYIPLFIPKETAHKCYTEYSKGLLWQILHYRLENLNYYNVQAWENYVKVNEIYTEAIAKVYKKGDIVWIIDYNLMLVPGMLRTRIPDINIGFYLRTPFPTTEIFKILPARRDLLEGMLGADLVGFQTYNDARHFLSSCIRLLGLDCSMKGVVTATARVTKLCVVPMGIEPSKFAKTLRSRQVRKMVRKMKAAFKDKKVIISRDRLNPVCGIVEKLEAFEEFLIQNQSNPTWKDKVVFIQICPPTEDSNSAKELTAQINKLVGKINGRFGSVEHTPVHYLKQELSLPRLCALYSYATAAVITPKRDGMNLVAHQFIACQQQKPEEQHGVLVISEFSGSAQSLAGAVLVNPFNRNKLTKIFTRALEMEEQDRIERQRFNYRYIERYDGTHWACTFLQELHLALSAKLLDAIVPRLNFDNVLHKYKSCNKRMFLFDYDGTLAPLAQLPQYAKPPKAMLEVLEKLASNKNNSVYIISGRERSNLDAWLGHLPVGLVSEHGIYLRPEPDKTKEIDKTYLKNIRWEPFPAAQAIDLSWKATIMPVLEDYTDRTPGSFIEEKQTNIAWHFRNADPEYGPFQEKELLETLQDITSQLPVDILVAKKAIELRPKGTGKGAIVKSILEKDNVSYDFVLCIGDDRSDEDMFTTIKDCVEQDNCVTCIIHKKPTKARYYIEQQQDVIRLLRTLASAE